VWDVEDVEIAMAGWILLGCCKEVSNAANQVFRRHFVLGCYRLITTMWFEWCHCHWCWACRTLSFAIVDQFGVAIGVAKRKVIQNN
jgi:hypothetical protein